MTDQDEKSTYDDAILPITAEKFGFSVEDLIACPNCSKPNGPDRNSCIYCGHELPKTELNVDGPEAPLPELEPWEPAVNLIISAFRSSSLESVSSAAHLLGLSEEVVTAIAGSGTPLPVARCAEDQVDSVANQLTDLGFQILKIGDGELNADRPPVRIRSAELLDAGIMFEDFNTRAKYTVAVDDLELIVTGRIYESRREEVTRRKRGAMTVLDEFETAEDLGVVDIYSSDDAVGFRVQATGFDFSLLGEDKELLADKNLTKFVDFLKRQFPDAIVAEEYDSIRSQLDIVWEPEIKKDLQGLQMRGYGKREFGTTFTSTNIKQFTRYSRMRRLML